MIVTVHGLKGCVKVHSYFESKPNFKEIDIFIDNRAYKVENYFYKKYNVIILKLCEVNDCDSARNFVNKKIYVEKTVLPQCREDEYYHVDLIGLAVEINQRKIGVITDIKNFGASDILEVKLENSDKKIMVPFTNEFCTRVDLDQKKVQVIDF